MNNLYIFRLRCLICQLLVVLIKVTPHEPRRSGWKLSFFDQEHCRLFQFDVKWLLVKQLRERWQTLDPLIRTSWTILRSVSEEREE
jgi:hypothetical protein